MSEITARLSTALADRYAIEPHLPVLDRAATLMCRPRETEKQQ